MGLFSFLKKKDKGKDAGLVPIGQNPEDLKENLIAKDDVPPGEDIPLPPSPEENSQPIMDVPLPDTPVPPQTDEQSPSQPEIPTEQPAETPEIPTEKATEPEEVSDAPVPPQEETPKKGVAEDLQGPEAPPEQAEETPKIPEEEKHEDSFELPDFTEDELKMGEEFQEQEIKPIETKPEETPAIEEQPVPETPAPSMEETTTPIMKEEPTEQKKKHYLSVDKCNFIFEKIYSDQDVLNLMVKNIQRQEVDKRKLLDNYKMFHDELDLIQEKFMQIDNSLFER